jgi:hypothetical protein
VNGGDEVRMVVCEGRAAHMAWSVNVSCVSCTSSVTLAAAPTPPYDGITPTRTACCVMACAAPPSIEPPRVAVPGEARTTKLAAESMSVSLLRMATVGMESVTVSGSVISYDGYAACGRCEEEGVKRRVCKCEEEV